MEHTPKYYIVEASALPDIFHKVAEAKRLLETGETDKVNVATRAVGISRSAFYKYRDTISVFCRRYYPFLPITAQIYSPSTRVSPPAGARWSRSPPRPEISTVLWKSWSI